MVSDLAWAVGLNYVIGELVFLAIDDPRRSARAWLAACPSFLMYLIVITLWPLTASLFAWTTAQYLRMQDELEHERQHRHGE